MSNAIWNPETGMMEIGHMTQDKRQEALDVSGLTGEKALETIRKMKIINEDGGAAWGVALSYQSLCVIEDALLKRAALQSSPQKGKPLFPHDDPIYEQRPEALPTQNEPIEGLKHHKNCAVRSFPNKCDCELRDLQMQGGQDE